MWYGIDAKGTVGRGLKVYMYDCGWGKNARRHCKHRNPRPDHISEKGTDSELFSGISRNLDM
jgi:hypothetical protein